MSEKTNVQISVEATPNPLALKFRLNQKLMEAGSFHYNNKEAAQESSLATRLFKVEGVTELLILPDFVTVNKSVEAQWETLVAQIRTIIEAVVSSGEPVVPQPKSSPHGEGSGEAASEDDKIAQKICEVLDKEIRPAVAQDGGDIIFYGYKDGIVTLHLQGACSSCPSSIMTLKMGVENRLKQACPEVQEVLQV